MYVKKGVKKKVKTKGRKTAEKYASKDERRGQKKKKKTVYYISIPILHLVCVFITTIFSSRDDAREGI